MTCWAGERWKWTWRSASRNRGVHRRLSTPVQNPTVPPVENPIFKRLTFAGVNIVTLAEGDITHLHIGFKATMNALFLWDLAEKTHRGLRGRVENGKAGGGLSYGYRVVRTLNGATVTTGEREIEPTEAAIVSTHLPGIHCWPLAEGDREAPEPGGHPGSLRWEVEPEHDSW